MILKKKIHVLILFVLVVVSTAKCQLLNQDELEAHRALESYVELKGGQFFMGINDREGVNFENPQRKAIVTPFR